MTTPLKADPEKLGLSYFAKAWFAEAAVYFARAKKLSANAQAQYAEALLNLGQPDDALAALKAVESHPRAALLKGRAELERGDAKAAIAALERARDATPDDPEVLLELGMALGMAGREAEADSLFTGLKASHPGHFQTVFDEANTFFGLKLFRLAKGRLVRAEKIARKDAALFYDLGLCYMDLNMAKEAETALKNAIRWRPTLEAYRELATVYEKSNQLDKALVFSRAPLAANPDDPYLNTVIAKCELRKGDAEAALARLERRAEALEEPHIKAEALNVLARIYDKLGRTGEAYKAFNAGNEEMKKTPEYGELELDYPYNNIAVYERLLEKGLPDLPKPKKIAGQPKSHVFFMGFPRSGTTLIQTILESHKSIATIDEKPVLRSVSRHLEEFPKGYPEALGALTADAAGVLREIYFTQARNFTAFNETTTLVDKMPLSTLHLPLILTVFPDAKILFAVRHPFASSLSCLMQNFNLNNAMGNLMNLDEITRFYAMTMGFWKTVSETCAFPRHVVCYERLTEDLEGEARGLTEFLELPWDPAMLDYAGTAKSKGIISTPSYHQVVQPVYKDAREKWRAYEKFFAPYRDRLDPFCKLFGYSS